MNSVRMLWLGVFLSLILSACYGRVDDREGHQRRLRPEAFGLSGDRPAVIVFSAAWCKPCRFEIPAFNRLKVRFGDRLDVIGFMVEGLQPGSMPISEDLERFSNAEGDRPIYQQTTDKQWKLFDSLKPQVGRTLPLTAFVKRDGDVLSLVQRSMLFESELAPLAEALLRDESVTLPSTAPQTTANKGLRWAQISDWVNEADVGRESPIYKAIENGWQTGLIEQGFSELDMPFENGSLKIISATDLAPPKILIGEWRSTSGCSLTVAFNPDGSVAGTTGICNTGG